VTTSESLLLYVFAFCFVYVVVAKPLDLVDVHIASVTGVFSLSIEQQIELLGYFSTIGGV